MKRNCLLALGLALFVAACGDSSGPTDANTSPSFASANATQRVNVLLKAPATAAQRGELGKFGTIYREVAQINGLLMRTKGNQIAAIRRLPYVKSVSQDVERTIGPIDLIPASIQDLSFGANVWNLDAINVTDLGAGRVIPQTGEGVYIGVLDSGLLPSWRAYFPDARIATQYAIALGGGGNDHGNVHEIPGKWDADVNAHGTHVTSIILGYVIPVGGQLIAINGTAPKATIIPVKVLNQNGSGWSSVVAQGVIYIADLAAGPLAGKPVVINMSLGGTELDDFEAAAIDYAIARGVVVVAAAGNSGPDGPETFPAAYEPVIAVASAGFVNEWAECTPGNPVAWWLTCDVPETFSASNFYISNFSGLRTGDQDLDVAAPGSWVVGPYQTNQGKLSWFFVGGTSQATPHVTGIVALMFQKNPTLGVALGARAARAEEILTAAAALTPLPDLDTADPNTLQLVRPGPGAAPAPVPDWTVDRSGAGLVTADAALNGTP
jgi:subtilisin family serine protease